MPKDALSVLRSKVSAELKLALKTGDKAKTRALRAVLHVLDHTTAVPLTSAHEAVYGRLSDVAPKAVSRQDIERALEAEAQERVAASVQYDHLGKLERAAELAEEATVIRGCLAYLDEAPNDPAI